MEKTVHRVMVRTAWQALAEQKQALVIACGAHPELPELDGLLHWIDALQDAAEAEGYPVVWLESPDA